MNIPEPVMVAARPLLKFSAKLPGWFSRWYWTAPKLSEKIEIESCTDRRTLYMSGAGIPNVYVNLKVTNLLPFDVRLDSLWCDVMFVGGTIARLQLMLGKTVKAASREVIYLDGTMTGPQRDAIERLTEAERDSYVKERQLRFSLRGELSCKVRRFHIEGREPGVHAPEFVNFKHKPPASK